MKKLKIQCPDCDGLASSIEECACEGKPFPEAYILEPHERVIDMRRVWELVGMFDPLNIGDRKIWEELKKELGIQ